MKFVWSTLNVTDIEKSIEFYTEIIGLKLEKRFTAGDNDIAFLVDENGHCEIELIQNTNNKNIQIGKDISWGFVTESLENTLKLLEEKNIKVLSPIIQPTPFMKFVMIQDPDGMNLQIVENIK